MREVSGKYRNIAALCGQDRLCSHLRAAARMIPKNNPENRQLIDKHRITSSFFSGKQIYGACQSKKQFSCRFSGSPHFCRLAKRQPILLTSL